MPSKNTLSVDPSLVRTSTTPYWVKGSEGSDRSTGHFQYGPEEWNSHSSKRSGSHPERRKYSSYEMRPKIEEADAVEHAARRDLRIE